MVALIKISLFLLVFIASTKQTQGSRIPRSPTDVCKLPQVTGPCKARITQFYFDAISNECKTFTYGGCEGNGNRFSTLEKCESKCSSPTVVCILPPETGHCRARFQRFYYDTTFNKCKTFIYGGCGGNGNRFSTFEKCKSKCAKIAWHK